MTNMKCENFLTQRHTADAKKKVEDFKVISAYHFF